ncbi:MAG: hypothetical protein GYA55_04625 [SAR324 cluster bacterium]|uniref:Transcription factor zinc-finger domain-containing protein n=1 Tax=SAR324 cluster bacterium TaxID=2024889 RepID=A0A7X9FRC2_9DELT|nr:hypothetical protein [SAR324 cluster bacterium]
MHKPSKKEQEYFIKKEMERLKKLREKHLSNTKAAERKKMKEAHYLHCAKCGQKMESTKFESIEIEVCPDCGGIYLDAGELDKILDEKRRGPFMNALALARRLLG